MKKPIELKLGSVCPMCNTTNHGYQIKQIGLVVTCRYCNRPYRIPKILWNNLMKTVRNDFKISRSIVNEVKP